MLDSMMVFAQGGDAAVAFGGLAFVAVAALIGIGSFILWLWALISAIQNPSLDSTMKVVWILVILFTAPIGPILYLLIGRK